MASVTFRDAKTGIDRTRRFAAQSADRLYDLVNAYVNEAGRVVKRPGFTGTALPAACRGLFGWHGKLQTFAATPQANPNPALFVINVLRHPTGGAAALSKIYSVQVSQGALYVAAEFADGVRKHYWLQPVYTWSGALPLSIDDLVQPTAPLGWIYQVQKNTTIKSWLPDKAYVVGNQVQPTSANGFYYQVTIAQGTNPQSGSFEPTWPTSSGLLVTEVHLATPPAITPGTTDTDGPQDPPAKPPGPNPQTRDRYTSSNA